MRADALTAHEVHVMQRARGEEDGPSELAEVGALLRAEEQHNLHALLLTVRAALKG